MTSTDYASYARQICADLAEQRQQSGINRVYAEWLDWADMHKAPTRFRRAVAMARFNAEVWIGGGAR